MPSAAAFRLQAHTCLQLASSAREIWVAVSLTELAEELLQRAVRQSERAAAGASVPCASDRPGDLGDRNAAGQAGDFLDMGDGRARAGGLG
jgi:hypothetical protein